VGARSRRSVGGTVLSLGLMSFFFFSSRRRHTRSLRDWSSDVCSSDLGMGPAWRVIAGLWTTPGTRAESDLDGSDRVAVQSLSCADCSVQAKVVNFAAATAALDLRESASNDRYDVGLLANGHLQIRRYNG